MSKGGVLIVGSDPDITRTLQVYLDAHQFMAQTVSRGDEALAVCRQSPPDALILDWALPDTDGYDLCQRIRMMDGTGGTFIIAVLPTNEREARLAALEAGADDVKALPIDIEEIRVRIEETLGH